MTRTISMHVTIPSKAINGLSADFCTLSCNGKRWIIKFHVGTTLAKSCLPQFTISSPLSGQSLKQDTHTDEAVTQRCRSLAHDCTRLPLSIVVHLHTTCSPQPSPLGVRLLLSGRLKYEKWHHMPKNCSLDAGKCFTYAGMGALRVDSWHCGRAIGNSFLYQSLLVPELTPPAYTARSQLILRY